jgi:uncharacterized protein (TIGR02246 family)
MFATSARAIVFGALLVSGGWWGRGYAQSSATLSAQDYIDIQQLYARYTHAIDASDAEAYAALFTADGSFNNNKGRDALLAFIKNRKAGVSMRHLNTNLVITPSPEGAKGAVYNMFLNVGETNPTVTGFSKYDDTLVKTPEGWRFKTRVNRREGPAAP